jgi:hypothetical protein
MNISGRIALGFIGGCFFFVIIFLMGWEASSPLSMLIWCLISLAYVTGVIASLCRHCSRTRIWYVPLSFSTPILIIGVISMKQVFTFFVIGLLTLIVGVLVAYVTVNNEIKE